MPGKIIHKHGAAMLTTVIRMNTPIPPCFAGCMKSL